jgi:hypothetical protein
MIEITQAEAEKRASKMEITPMTEQEEFDVVMFDIKDWPMTAAQVAMGQDSITNLKKRAKEALKREVFNRKFRIWAAIAAAQWDNRRNRYICYGLNK